MTVTRLTIAAGVVVYLALWVVAFDGATGLVEPLLIPLILAVLVASGVALNRFIGISPRKQHFEDGEDES